MLVHDRRLFYSPSNVGDLPAGRKDGAMDKVVVKSRLEPLHQQSAPLRKKILAALRSAIETRVLEPGTRLVEKDLCEQLSVSRTSLREALRELQAEGVLEYTTHRGLSVSAISLEDAWNVYRLRSIVEALVVEQFIENADERKTKALMAESEKLKSAFRAGVLENMLSAKRAFYDRICSGAENPVAFDTINRLVLRTSSIRARSLLRKQRQSQSIEEIEVLMDAIQDRDIPTARAAAIAHVMNAAHSALDNFE